MWRRKLKKISSVLVVLMFGIQLILNANIFSGLDDFAKNLIKVSKKDADDVGKSLTKNIGKSEKTIQSKIDDIPITIKQDETKLLIFNKADEIINKFPESEETRLFNEFENKEFGSDFKSCFETIKPLISRLELRNNV